jgi:hypothetical protein
MRAMLSIARAGVECCIDGKKTQNMLQELLGSKYIQNTSLLQNGACKLNLDSIPLSMINRIFQRR